MNIEKCSWLEFIESFWMRRRANKASTNVLLSTIIPDDVYLSVMA